MFLNCKYFAILNAVEILCSSNEKSRKSKNFFFFWGKKNKESDTKWTYSSTQNEKILPLKVEIHKDKPKIHGSTSFVNENKNQRAKPTEINPKICEDINKRLELKLSKLTKKEIEINPYKENPMQLEKLSTFTNKRGSPSNKTSNPVIINNSSQLQRLNTSTFTKNVKNSSEISECDKYCSKTPKSTVVSSQRIININDNNSNLVKNENTIPKSRRLNNIKNTYLATSKNLSHSRQYPRILINQKSSEISENKRFKMQKQKIIPTYENIDEKNGKFRINDNSNIDEISYILPFDDQLDKKYTPTESKIVDQLIAANNEKYLLSTIKKDLLYKNYVFYLPKFTKSGKIKNLLILIENTFTLADKISSFYDNNYKNYKIKNSENLYSLGEKIKNFYFYLKESCGFDFLERINLSDEFISVKFYEVSSLKNGLLLFSYFEKLLMFSVELKSLACFIKKIEAVNFTLNSDDNVCSSLKMLEILNSLAQKWFLICEYSKIDFYILNEN